MGVYGIKRVRHGVRGHKMHRSGVHPLSSTNLCILVLPGSCLNGGGEGPGARGRAEFYRGGRSQRGVRNSYEIRARLGVLPARALKRGVDDAVAESKRENDAGRRQAGRWSAISS